MSCLAVFLAVLLDPIRLSFRFCWETLTSDAELQLFCFVLVTGFSAEATVTAVFEKQCLTKLWACIRWAICLFQEKIRVLYVRILENETANFKLSMKFFRSPQAKGKETMVLFSRRAASSAVGTRDAVVSQSDCAQPHCKVRHHLFIELMTFVWAVLYTQTNGHAKGRASLQEF